MRKHVADQGRSVEILSHIYVHCSRPEKPDGCLEVHWLELWRRADTMGLPAVAVSAAAEPRAAGAVRWSNLETQTRQPT